MPQIFYDELIKQGYPIEKIKVIPNELEAVSYILTEAAPNDMNLLCSCILIHQ